MVNRVISIVFLVEVKFRFLKFINGDQRGLILNRLQKLRWPKPNNQNQDYKQTLKLSITASDVIKAKRQNLIMFVPQDIFDPRDLINNLINVQLKAWLVQTPRLREFAVAGVCGCGSLRMRVVAVSSGFKRFVWLVLRLEISVFAGYLWLVNY